MKFVIIVIDVSYRARAFSNTYLPKLADISLNTVVKIELDQSPNPTLETIQKLAKALGVSLDDLTK